MANSKLINKNAYYKVPQHIIDEINKDNRLKLNEIQTFNSFPKPFLWTPVEKQIPVGGTHGNVKLPFESLESPNFRQIIINANNYYSTVDIEADTYKVYIKSLVLYQLLLLKS